MSLAENLVPTRVSRLPACSHGSLSGPPRLCILTVHTATGQRVMTRCSLLHVAAMALCFCHVSNAWAVLPRQTCPFSGDNSGRAWSSVRVSLECCLADLYLTAHSHREKCSSSLYPNRGFRTNLDGAGSLIESGSKICYCTCARMLGSRTWLFQDCCPQRVPYLLSNVLSNRVRAHGCPRLTPCASRTSTPRRHIVWILMHHLRPAP